MADGYKGTAHYRKAHEDWLKTLPAERGRRDKIHMDSLAHDKAMKAKYRAGGAKYRQDSSDSLAHDTAMKAKYRAAGAKYK